MIFYLTYNDLPSGVFTSQVVDTVVFLNKNLNVSTKLVSLISIRNFFKNRSHIKKQLPGAIVIPMFPGVHRWKYNGFLLNILCLFYNPKIIIARSVIATHLALRIKSTNTKVVYDGRGAISAEWHEYDVIKNSSLLNSIFQLEKEVVINSDYRIAVSNELVKYWKEQFNYQLFNHVIIPCTINQKFENVLINENILASTRNKFDLLESDIVFIYSGSIAGWQSFDVLLRVMTPILQENIKCKLVFFSELNENIQSLINLFPSQIFCKYLKSDEVCNYLIIGDYGLLIREESLTNKVASPVKFAEYLACGLKVIISDNLGDYSELIKKNNDLGVVIEDNISKYDNVSIQDKIIIKNFALAHFTKVNYIENFQKMLEFNPNH